MGPMESTDFPRRLGASADHSRRVIRPSNRMQHIFFNRFLGARNARFLYETGMINRPVSEIKRLDDVFQSKPPFLMDFF